MPRVRPAPSRVRTPRLRRPRRPGPVPPALRPGGTYRRSWSRSSTPTASPAPRSLRAHRERPVPLVLPAFLAGRVVVRRRLRLVPLVRLVVVCMPPRRCSRVVRVRPVRPRPPAPRIRPARPDLPVPPGRLVRPARPAPMAPPVLPVGRVVVRRRLRLVLLVRLVVVCMPPRRCLPVVRVRPVRPRPPAPRIRPARPAPRARVPRPARSRPAHPVSPVRVVRTRRRPRRARPVRRTRADPAPLARRAPPVCRRPPALPFRGWRRLRARPRRGWRRSPAMRIRRRPPVSRPWDRAIWRCCATAPRTARSSS